MDTSEDLYSILGVLHSADTEIIKAVFRTLAKRYHPDRFSDPAAADQGKEHFIKIQKAYEILINPETRAQYDREYNEDRGDRGEFRADAGPDEARDDNSEDFGDAELAADWATAIEYFPEVEKIRKELARLYRDLSVLFKLALIERKSFASSEAK